MGAIDFFEMSDFKPLLDGIQSIVDIPDEEINEESVDIIVGMIKGAFSESSRENSISSIVRMFEKENANKNEIINAAAEFKERLNSIEEEINPGTKEKQYIVSNIFSLLTDVVDDAASRYAGGGKYDVVVKFQLTNPNAHLPTYAHEDDAGADVYATETVTLAPYSFGNMIETGLKADIPSGWLISLRPRSGLSAKTTLRLSNCVATIDAGYKGEIKVLLDNLGDEPVTINAGDRIAQMLIERSYRFKPVQTEDVGTSERGQGGFGSSGK